LEDPGADGRIILKMDSLVSQNTKNFLTSWRPVSFSRRTLLHGVSKLQPYFWYRKSISQTMCRQNIFNDLPLCQNLTRPGPIMYTTVIPIKPTWRKSYAWSPISYITFDKIHSVHKVGIFSNVHYVILKAYSQWRSRLAIRHPPCCN
jgi:hypothetical protein